MAVTLDLMEWPSDAEIQAAYVSSLKYDPNLKLWSKLESAGDVTSPQVGTGGSVTGAVAYAAAKFGNGIISDAGNEYAQFPCAANSINMSKGAIDCWIKPTYAPTDGATHIIWEFYDTANGGLILFKGGAENDFVIGVRSGGVWAIKTVIGYSWNANDLFHIAVTWDRQGNDIGSSKTLVVKIDNVEEYSSTTTWNDDTFDANITIGAGDDGASHSDTVIDNLKTYDYCKIDFSDKDTEDAGHGVQCFSESVIVKQGTYSLEGLAGVTDALNETLTRTVDPTIDLSDQNAIEFWIRSSRTGQNIKIGIHDAGGTTTEITPNILSANTWQKVVWNISAVTNANKDAIDSIIITIVNAD